KFPGGKVLEYGLEQNGVGIAPTTENVSKKALDAVSAYKKKIIDGSITVPTTDKEYKEYLANLK
ncbi:MAG: family transporter substrate-binding protein, partial [Sporolactobacillus laevolacticus]|nr:family transporter substrate-binding protein [Sporolactobacillus laevolacticus]